MGFSLQEEVVEVTKKSSCDKCSKKKKRNKKKEGEIEDKEK